MDNEKCTCLGCVVYSRQRVSCPKCAMLEESATRYADDARCSRQEVNRLKQEAEQQSEQRELLAFNKEQEMKRDGRFSGKSIETITAKRECAMNEDWQQIVKAWKIRHERADKHKKYWNDAATAYATQADDWQERAEKAEEAMEAAKEEADTLAAALNELAEQLGHEEEKCSAYEDIIWELEQRAEAAEAKLAEATRMANDNAMAIIRAANIIAREAEDGCEYCDYHNGRECLASTRPMPHHGCKNGIHKWLQEGKK